jgi:hypothetical protein
LRRPELSNEEVKRLMMKKKKKKKKKGDFLRSKHVEVA